MIILDCDQLSPEWFNARVGIPSASNFSKIVTSTGKPSKSRLDYMRTLAGERLLGAKEESYQSPAMQRGIELEEEARNLYSFTTGNEVTEVGLCYQDEKKLYSASPDGLVNNDGTLEIKAPSLKVHIKYVLAGKTPAEYYAQVQGQLLTTGRPWADFVSYYPGLPIFIYRQKRDESFQELLQCELIRFCNDLKLMEQKLRG